MLHDECYGSRCLQHMNYIHWLLCRSEAEFDIADLAILIESAVGEVGLWVFGLGFVAAAVSSMIATPLGAALTAESTFTVRDVPTEGIICHMLLLHKFIDIFCRVCAQKVPPWESPPASSLDLSVHHALHDTGGNCGHLCWSTHREGMQQEGCKEVSVLRWVFPGSTNCSGVQWLLATFLLHLPASVLEWWGHHGKSSSKMVRKHFLFSPMFVLSTYLDVSGGPTFASSLL